MIECVNIPSCLFLRGLLYLDPEGSMEDWAFLVSDVKLQACEKLKEKSYKDEVKNMLRPVRHANIRLYLIRTSFREIF